MCTYLPAIGCESGKCRNVARFAVSEHNVNNCDTMKYKISVLCENCVRELSRRLENALAAMWQRVPVTWEMNAEVPHCTTCNRSLFALHDVLDVELI